MPGLLRGVARTAVVAGTATAVSNRVSRRQATRWSLQAGAEGYDSAPQGYAEPPPAPPQQTEEDPLAKLKQLGELHSSGVLTDEEFAAAKAKILNG